jgi:hypothetical protein
MFSPLLPAPFPPANNENRDALLQWVRGVSLVYGPWKTFKRLFKDAEAAYSSGQQETEIFAALLARIDNAPFAEASADRKSAPPVVQGAFKSIQVANDLLYAIEGDDTLVVYDLSAPLEPREVFRYTPTTSSIYYGSQCWIEGERLVYGNAQLLRVFSLENPQQPQFLFESGPIGSGQITVCGDLVFVADHQNLRVLKWPAPGAVAFTEVGSAPAGYPYNLVVKPGLVGISHWDTQRRRYANTFFEVSDSAAPVQISQINAVNPNQWKFQGDVLVRITGDELIFADISNPKNPRQISSFRVGGARNFHISGDKIYVSCYEWHNTDGRYRYEYKVRILDISQVHSPRLVGEFESQAGQMAAYGDLLYVVDGGLKIFDVADASRVQSVGQRPKNGTFAYLKRRSRRFLRILAEADENAFVTLANAFLIESGQNRDALILKSNWSSAELTLGGGARWHQSSHGRGAYVKDGAKFVLKTREERAPRAWDAHLDVARALWNHPHLPWQTQEMALKILWGHGERPTPSAAQISRFLWSDSPALLKYAARHGLSRLVELEGQALAPLLWVSNSRQRRDILSAIDAQVDVKNEVAIHLAVLLGRNARNGLSRRAREIALLMAARFDLSNERFDSDGALPVIQMLIASAEAPLRTLGLNLCRRLSPQFAVQALRDLLSIPAPYRGEFVASLTESASRGPLPVDIIDEIVRHPDSEIRDAAWLLIAASRTSDNVLQAVWTKLFTGLRRESVYEGDRYRSRYLGERWTESVALQTAVNSDAALLTLGRCGLGSEDVLPKFNSSLFTPFEAAVSPAMWGAYSLILPASTVVDVALNAPGWNLNDGAWRTAWVRANAPHLDKLAAFWNAVQAFLDGNATADQKRTLQERTFEQGDVAATFGGAASRLSPTLLMSLIGAVPENLWLDWRESLLQTLQNDATTRDAFWDAARRSPALESGFLRARLLEDEEFAATFGLLETDALEADNPAFAPLILAWLRERQQSLGRPSWIEAAIHPLPVVRDFALAQLEAVGLDVPGALTLLDSRLPPSIKFGQDWFLGRGENHLETALALCDSPQLSVRAFGREFIAAHFEVLLQAGLIGYLNENPNSEMQAFVAAQLKEHPQLASPEFDRAVLRSRQRARHAKNLIHERTTQGSPLADDKTLLQIARGRTPRDSEWALAQLARRALEGAQVEGVEVGTRREI